MPVAGAVAASPAGWAASAAGAGWGAASGFAAAPSAGAGVVASAAGAAASGLAAASVAGVVWAAASGFAVASAAGVVWAAPPCAAEPCWAAASGLAVSVPDAAPPVDGVAAAPDCWAASPPVPAPDCPEASPPVLDWREATRAAPDAVLTESAPAPWVWAIRAPSVATAGGLVTAWVTVSVLLPLAAVPPLLPVVAPRPAGSGLVRKYQLFSWFGISAVVLSSSTKIPR